MFLNPSSSVSSFLRRVNFTGSLQVLAPGAGEGTRASRHYRAVCCSRVCRRSTECTAAVSRARVCFIGRVGCDRAIWCYSVPGVAPLALSAAPRRGYSDATSRNRIVFKVNNELESLSSVVMPQTRRSSTAPEKTREQRVGQINTKPLSGSSAEGPGSDEKPTKIEQLRKVFKEYGAVGVSFHIGISLISLGMFYLAVSSGVDMASVLCKLGFSEAVVQSKMAAGTSTFVLAYAVHKLFAPVRISITLVSVPLIVRHLRKTGLFKPRTSAP